MDANSALELMLRILGVLAIVQSAEYLILKDAWSEMGVWRWSVIKQELAGSSRLALAFWGTALGTRGFLLLNFARIAIASYAVVRPEAWAAAALLLLHIFTLLRFRGGFNGGSDSMSLLLLLSVAGGLIVEKSSGPSFAFLWYAALHLLLSYYRAGFVKVKNRLWRDGRALRSFLLSPRYAQSGWSRAIANSPFAMKAAAWLIMIFELSFPLALLNSNWATAYMAAGAVFHLANVFGLGLNRFFFAWLAAYPALYYCAQ